MTQEQIIAGNKAIAEYMEIPKCQRCTDCGGFQYSPTIIFIPEQMGYHKSWDWLMPVVKKTREVLHQDYSGMDRAINKVDLSASWEAVVEFIKNIEK